jgi:hypothetical protein
MSKVSIAGDVNGTGVFTIASPNSNANRTLTLPDVTATVITDSAGVLNIGAGQVYKDASGNVGIGTSSPAYKLQSYVNNGATAGVSYPIVSESTSSAAGNTNGVGVGFIQANRTAAAIEAVRTNPAGDYGFALVFKTNATTQANSGFPLLTERARIDGLGNLLVGTTTNPYGSKVVASGGFTSTNSTQFNIAGTAATNFEFVLRTGAGMQFYVNNATVIGTLTASGVWTNASDARYKENIRPVSYGLAEVMQLLPREYNIIGSEKQEIGFVAQEVEPLIPELVESTTNSVTGEDRLSLSYGQLSAVLVKAIQELKAIVDAQGAEIASLKGASA